MSLFSILLKGKLRSGGKGRGIIGIFFPFFVLGVLQLFMLLATPPQFFFPYQFFYLFGTVTLMFLMHLFPELVSPDLYVPVLHLPIPRKKREISIFWAHALEILIPINVVILLQTGILVFIRETLLHHPSIGGPLQDILSILSLYLEKWPLLPFGNFITANVLSLGLFSLYFFLLGRLITRVKKRHIKRVVMFSNILFLVFYFGIILGFTTGIREAVSRFFSPTPSLLVLYRIFTLSFPEFFLVCVFSLLFLSLSLIFSWECPTYMKEEERKVRGYGRRWRWMELVRPLVIFFLRDTHGRSMLITILFVTIFNLFLGNMFMTIYIFVYFFTMAIFTTRYPNAHFMWKVLPVRKGEVFRDLIFLYTIFYILFCLVLFFSGRFIKSSSIPSFFSNLPASAVVFYGFFPFVLATMRHYPMSVSYREYNFLKEFLFSILYVLYAGVFIGLIKYKPPLILVPAIVDVLIIYWCLKIS